MKWKDGNGRQWDFVCDYFTLQRVKRETGVNLTESLTDIEVIKGVIDDPEKFFDVAISLIQDDLKSLDITAEDFGRSINDEGVVENMTEALVESILSFFPPARRDPLLKAFRKIWDLSKRRAALQVEQATARMNGPEFEREMNEAVASGFNNTEPTRSGGVADSPAKSGSVPAD